MLVQDLENSTVSKEQLVHFLGVSGEERTELFKFSAAIKEKYVGNKVYLRGLIEFSNVCSKNCYYCGIRKDNQQVNRYSLSDEEVLDAARFAYENDYGSLVLQSGEIESKAFTSRIETLLHSIKKLSNGKLGITLSCGEQATEVYQRWFDAGAHRYLLRIEASSESLYRKLHPNNDKHSWEKRIACLDALKKSGYQVGTGVMIGLPFQTLEDLADDLLFMKEFDIDMCGMGPYIEHEDTPLYAYRDSLMPLTERFDLTLKMVSLLRILMKDINIAATTAMQAIDKVGREKAIRIGANVLMPNITPGEFRNDYKLYENKPCTDENADDCKGCIDARIKMAGSDIGYGEWGDSMHFKRKLK